VSVCVCVCGRKGVEPALPLDLTMRARTHARTHARCVCVCVCVSTVYERPGLVPAARSHPQTKTATQPAPRASPVALPGHASPTLKNSILLLLHYNTSVFLLLRPSYLFPLYMCVCVLYIHVCVCVFVCEPQSSSRTPVVGLF